MVSFSGGSRGRPTREVLQNPCQESFILFQIGLLREYLELEFKNDALPFPYDVERIIDDFVLFCMLIGNDFLPGGLLRCFVYTTQNIACAAVLQFLIANSKRMHYFIQACNAVLQSNIKPKSLHVSCTA